MKDAHVDAIVIVNRLGTVEEVDEGACAFFGYSKIEMLGLHGSELVPPDLHTSTAVSIDRMQHGEIPLAVHTRVQRKDGCVIEVDISVHLLARERMAFHIARAAAG